MSQKFVKSTDQSKVYRFHIDHNELLESLRPEIPEEISLKVCGQQCHPDGQEMHSDGDISIMNFVSDLISLKGMIKGYLNDKPHLEEFLVSPKESLILNEWDYSESTMISISCAVILPNDSKIDFMIDFLIPMDNRCLHLVFHT